MISKLALTLSLTPALIPSLTLTLTLTLTLHLTLTLIQVRWGYVFNNDGHLGSGDVGGGIGTDKARLNGASS